MSHGTFEWKGITHHRPGPRRPSTKFEKRVFRELGLDDTDDTDEEEEAGLTAGNQGSGAQRGTFQGAGGNGGTQPPPAGVLPPPANGRYGLPGNTKNSVKPGPGQTAHRPPVKGKSWTDVVKKNLTQDQPPLSAIDAIDVRGDKDSQQPAREQMRATAATDTETFLDDHLSEYETALKNHLNDITADLDDHQKCGRVFKAFVNAFGQMLKETRQNCFDGWMKRHADEAVTKENWVEVFKEASTLWKKVVDKFRQMYRQVNSAGIQNGIQIQEPEEQGKNFDINGLQIWCYPPFLSKKTNVAVEISKKTNVAVEKWSNNLKYAFSQNIQKFVLEYQQLLQDRFKKIKLYLFDFRFDFSDLCQWIKDVQERATRSGGDVNRQDTTVKPFRWPRDCKKGVSFAKPNHTIAYKQFCRWNDLEDDWDSRRQFCMRMRATWLRLVACYPFDKDGKPPTQEALESYLRKQHVFEIELFKITEGKKKGKTDFAEVGYSDLLLHPEKHVEDCKDEQWKDHRVLVYGAPMRAANPYLVSPR